MNTDIKESNPQIKICNRIANFISTWIGKVKATIYDMQKALTNKRISKEKGITIQHEANIAICL